MNSHSGKLMFQVIFLLVLADAAFSEANNRTPAQILAKRTGAAQFEEHIEPLHHNCKDQHHRLRKRSSDEYPDYEVYQGVVGRPGIDFPIFPRIPQTTFSCRTYGNGYFADLETGCQAFHICEEGRKISFLCPNGTIFQQSELTCDWWFKVNCAGSPSYYVESSEVLHKARRQRIKPSVYTKTNKAAEVITTGKPYKGSERRIDSNENPSIETLDFEDISDDRTNETPNIKSNDRTNARGNERTNGRANDRSNDRTNARGNDRTNARGNGRSNGKANDRSNGKSNDGSNGRSNEQSNGKPYGRSNESTEKSIIQPSNQLSDKLVLSRPPLDDDNIHKHNDHELQITAESSSFVKDPRNSFADADKPLNKKQEFSSPSTTGKISYYTTAAPEPFTNRNSLDDQNVGDKQIITPNIFSNIPPVRVSTSTISYSEPETYKNRNSLDGEVSSRGKQFVTPDFLGSGPLLKSSTPSSYPGTYSTARRLESTRTTPFYTPTIPTVVKTKPTESRNFFVNVVKTDEPTTLRGAVTTDNATPKPIVIGMRRSGDNSDTHHVPINFNGDTKIQVTETSVNPQTPTGISSSSTSPSISTSGPTYLPKSTEGNKNSPVTPSNIPNVSSNIRGILETVDVLEETMKGNLDGKYRNTRVGLDIPPSSGPGTLISLTNYFANDDQVGSASTVSPDLEQNDSEQKSSEDKSSEDKSSEDKSSEHKSTEQKISEPKAAEAKTPSTVDITSGHVSNKTSGKYFNLFGLKQNNSDAQNDHVPTATTASPKIEQSPTVIGDFTRSTIKDLAQNAETRKIAQVFSNAINKYIENPETFRKDLIDVRPQAPEKKSSIASDQSYSTPSGSSDTNKPITVNTEQMADGIPGKRVTQPYSSTTTTRYETTEGPTTTESNDIAKEINHQLDVLVSTSSYESYSTESADATALNGITFSTSRPGFYIVQTKTPNTAYKSSKSITFDKNTNNLDNSGSKVTTSGNPWLQNQKQTVKPTENPWSQITQSIYVDPLTINDGLMRQPKTTTLSPFSFVNTDRSRFEDVSDGEEGVGDILNSAELSSELLPKDNGLQRIANKIFGGLNETEAFHLKNVMKRAEHNQGILRLLLLLIQTCDDPNGKALEKSRKLLLNALIGMDNKTKSSTPVTITTTSKIPVTTYRRVFSDSTTTVASPTTTDTSTSSEETTKFEIRVPELEDENNSITSSENPNRTSDQRALELLKSLYSLASKFSRR